MFVKVVCFFLLAMAGIDDVIGCSCRVAPATELLCDPGHFVIKGTVQEIKRYSYFSSLHVVSVDEEFWLPRQASGKKQISINIPSYSSALCAVTLQQGTTYFITGFYHDNRFATNLCYQIFTWDDTRDEIIDAVREHLPCAK